MIPIQLELQAFLPFGERQVLDFSNMMSDGIFLVCGNTGSGKTAIFDAICFALFGKPSGEKRASKHLKSHFAEDSTEVYVSFVFAVGEKQYHIRRTPFHYRFNRNHKMTKYASTAVLTLPNNSIISGVKEVDHQVEEILGIGLSQFKKIMMLPQGEFQQFLSDNSADKQKILQHIFDTDLYRQAEERLRQQYTEWEKRIQTLQSHLSTGLADLMAAHQGITSLMDHPLDVESIKTVASGELSNHDIEQVLQQAQQQQQQRTHQLSLMTTQLKQIRNQYQEINLDHAKKQNEQLNHYHQLQQEYQLVSDQQPDMEALKTNIQQLRCVKELQLMQQHYKESVAQQIQKKQQHLHSEKQQKIAQEKLKQATQQLNQQKQQQNHISRLLEQVTVWETQIMLLKQQQQTLHLVKQTEEDIQCLENRWQLFQLQQQQQQLSQQQKTLNNLFIQVNQTQQTDQRYIQQQQQYQHLFTQFISSQAYELSKQLRPNQPCPVCGSCDHPLKSAPDPNVSSTSTLYPPLSMTVTPQQLDQAKKEYEQITTQLQQQQLALQTAWYRLSSDVLVCPLPDEWHQAHVYQDQKKMIDTALQALHLQQSHTQHHLATYSLDKEDNQAFADFDEQKFTTTLEQLVAKKNLLQQQLLSLKQQITTSQSLSQLEQKVIEQQEYITIQQNKLDQLEKLVAEHHMELARLEEVVVQYAQQIDQWTPILDQQSLEIKQKLHDYGLTKTIYQELVPQLHQLQQLEEQFNHWQQRQQHLKGSLDVYEQATKGMEMLDLHDLKQQKKQQKQQLLVLQKKIDHLQACHTLSQQAIYKLNKYYKQYNLDGGKYEEIKMLYQVTAGIRGARVSLERYVLGVYFDRVIYSANDRLTEMTAGRYRLRRCIDKQQGNASAGLELEIFDSYNGRFRDVSSLSGGEIFQTALCLALGLADVISQQAGGVELNTLLIDEGFGTLDQQALDHAIENLMRLRAHGKYIGLISHVRELQERIPCKLLITQHKQGSRAEFTL